MVRVALDAMGADGGVRPLVEGACRLSLEDAPISITLVGDEREVRAALRGARYDSTRIHVAGAEGAVRMTDKPAEALERMPDCSVLTAGRLVRAGDADALVSAGNTGAVILGAATF